MHGYSALFCPHDRSLPITVLLIVLACVIVSLGLSISVTSHAGACSNDLIPVIAHEKLARMQIRTARMLWDGVCIIAGYCPGWYTSGDWHCNSANLVWTGTSVFRCLSPNGYLLIWDCLLNNRSKLKSKQQPAEYCIKSSATDTVCTSAVAAEHPTQRFAVWLRSCHKSGLYPYPLSAIDAVHQDPDFC